MSILKEIVGKIDVEKEKRVKRAQEDFAYFCEHYLAEAFPVKFAKYQKEIIEIINKRAISENQIKSLKRFIKVEHQDYFKPLKTIEGILDIEPRDHGKTTRMSQAFPLWLILTKRNVFPVIVAASADTAGDILDSIKLELENNERLIEDFGDLKGHIWTRRKIALKNGNAIAALGAGQSSRGIKDRYKRPTHIICDDLLKDQEVESPISREKLYRWFKRVVMNLGKGALIVIVNTIMHPDDLPSRLLNEIKDGKLKGWIGLRFSAITPEGKPLWPERWSIEDIEKKREQLGSYVFATEWENEPIPAEEQKFRREWFQFYTQQDLRNIKLRIIMAIDPATGKATSDYSAIVVTGKSESNQIYVLDAEGERISDLKLIRRIIDKYRAWRPEKIIFETQVFQEIYKNQLVREGMREGIILPVKGVKHTVSKEMRISKLQSLVESGNILFKENQTLLLSQLEEFPKGHDDLPDALEMAVSELIERRKPEPVAIPLGIHRDTKVIFKNTDFMRSYREWQTGIRT